MSTIRIEAGDQTEDLIQFVTKQLDDATLDEIEIKREVEWPSGLASEPITIAVTMIGMTVIVEVTRLVERWLEKKRQIETLKIVASAPTNEIAEQLTRLAEKHVQVSIKYELSKESWGNKQ